MNWPRIEGTHWDHFGVALDVLHRRERLAHISSAVDCFEFEMATKFLHPGDRAIVAGCGLGSVAGWASVLLGVENVLAFEPNPTLVSMVLDNCRVGGKPLNLQHAALGSHDGPGTLYLSRKWDQSSLVKDNVPAINLLAEIPVRVVGANEIIAEFGANALLLDIEGGEWDVMDQLDTSKLDAIVMEIHGDDPEPIVEQVVASFQAEGRNIERADFAPHLHILGAQRPTYTCPSCGGRMRRKKPVYCDSCLEFDRAEAAV